jgi:methionine-rich copper-binding protein CopC
MRRAISLFAASLLMLMAIKSLILTLRASPRFAASMGSLPFPTLTLEGTRFHHTGAWIYLVFLMLLGALAVLFQSIRSRIAWSVVAYSSPASNEVLPFGEHHVRILFDRRIDHGSACLTLYRPNGDPVTITIRSDSALDVIAAQIRNETAGRCRLHWEVADLNGKLMKGDIPFKIEASK